jgi:hypothetical protein
MTIFHKLTATLTAMALALPVTLLADTVIELNSDTDAITFMSNGSMARINTSGKNEYMIVDFARKAIYAVSPDQRQFINLNQSVTALSDNAPPEVNLAFTPTGNGPVVAGYATRSYRYSANGEYCGTVQASKEALDGTSIGDMLDVMNEMAKNARKALGGFAAVIPPCRQADMSLGSQVNNIGVPMQTIDTHGQVQRSINKITKNVNVDASNYVLPPDYKAVNVADKINKAQQTNPDMDQLQNRAPQIQGMLHQMQQSGRLSPQAMERMQRYQEMLQQQQR